MLTPARRSETPIRPTTANSASVTPGISLIAYGLYGLLLVGQSAQLLAQGQKKAADELPPPVADTLTTEDGVTLHYTFYPSKKGKEAVPVLLLHGWEGRGSDLGTLAQYLHQQGHAVLLPDLRGHGQSNQIKNRLGKEETIDLSRMRRNDVLAVEFDLRACKRLLLEKNNAGEVNVDLLCVVAVEESAAFALLYAQKDLNTRDLPAYRLGRDIKGLVFLTPKLSIKGVTAVRALNDPIVRGSAPVPANSPTALFRPSFMIVAGSEDARSFADAKAMNTRLKAWHPDPEPKDVAEQKDLFFIDPPTELQGADLLKLQSRPGLPAVIDQFITLRMVNKADQYPWAERFTGAGS